MTDYYVEGLSMYRYESAGSSNWVLCVKISQAYFLNVLQSYVNAADRSIELKLRIAFRDSRGDVIMEGTNKELSSTFIIGVKGSEEKTGCEEATVSFQSGTTDRTVALGQVIAGTYDFKEINIDRPLAVKFNNFASCSVEPTFVVLIKDGDIWRQWEAMGEILRKEAESAGHWITSWI
jgi:hypothetical protein